MLHRGSASGAGAPLLTPARPQILPPRSQQHPTARRTQAIIFSMAVLVSVALALVAIMGGLRGPGACSSAGRPISRAPPVQLQRGAMIITLSSPLKDCPS